MCRWCCWYAGRAPFMRSGDSSRSVVFAALSGSEWPLTLLPALLVPGMARSLSLFNVLLLVFVGDNFPLCGCSVWVEEPLPPPPLFTTSTMGEAAAISFSYRIVGGFQRVSCVFCAQKKCSPTIHDLCIWIQQSTRQELPVNDCFHNNHR